ncbi:MAG: cytochrome bc complex cytochrome b subunit [Nitrososphaerales archaeon]|nr:cytochrome bc complex cytochrome b subunit [Nitrososphaerales archaeon]
MSANPGRRFVEWVKSRFGLRTNVLRPVPEYSLSPLYWLGALTVIAFALQVFTGLLMMIYYVPTVDQAYSSTQFIIRSVPLGWLLETVHLYGAYAMILLAMLHLLRGYFLSVQKKPREMMWVIGVVMGLAVMGFGLTGYLLPWTVVSKSATDVSIGMLSFLPAQIGPIVTFLIAGDGSSAGELTRFFDLHIVVLPAMLLSLLALKLFLFEAHGAAEPATGAKESREIPWFPTVYLYFAMIGSVLIAVIVMASVLFPVNLAAQFTPLAASNYVPQPEWYFLWMYQVLKFTSFEGSGIYYALGAVTILLVGLIVLPFIDRGLARNPRSRPLYTTVGTVVVAELVVLTAWGYLTPGQIIPDVEAVEVIGTVALAAALATAFLLRTPRGIQRVSSATKPVLLALVFPLKNRWAASVFVVLLSVGSVCFANLVDSIFGIALSSPVLILNITGLITTFYAMARIMRSLTVKYERSQP